MLANALQLAEPPVVFVPASFYDVMGMGFFLILISFVFFVIWYISIGLRLFQLGRSKPGEKGD
jgi:hypothetical protein